MTDIAGSWDAHASKNQDIKSSIFVIRNAVAPKSGVEFWQGSIGSIRGSLATPYNVWRCRARKKLCWHRVGGLVSQPICRFLVHFIDTSWSNLQACKISSIAETPKLDRVWQLESHRSWGDAHLNLGAAQAPPNYNGIDLRLINFDNHPIFRIKEHFLHFCILFLKF